MSKKVIKVTFIETPGHGYLSVSKKDFILVGCKPEQISGYSGHSFTRLYLEEDCDASIFLNQAKTQDYNVIINRSYRESFGCTHNYNAEYFDYTPNVGDILNGLYKVKLNNRNILYLEGAYNIVYKMPNSDGFFNLIDKIQKN